MEQSKFILEVRARQCIWNPWVTTYLDRVLKRQAWEEVAAKMYRGFHSCSDNEKTEKVRELQKKWKSLKDYYKRRNPDEDIDENTNQKRPIVELLQFLDTVTKFNQHLRTQQQLAEQIKKIKKKNLIFQLPDYKITVEKFNNNQPSKPQRKNFRSKSNLDLELEQNEDIKFLHSLLPVMQSLNDRQRLDFKLEVMMLIKKIKYEKEDTQRSSDSSHENSSSNIRPTIIESTSQSRPMPSRN